MATYLVTSTATPGQHLPEFSLPALISGDYGQEYTNLTQDFGHGHWRMFVHWPSTSLLTCPRELSEIGRRLEEFRELDVVVLGIAGDTHSILHSLRSNGRQPGKLPYPIIDDRKQEWAKAMKLTREDSSTITPRTIVVDPLGAIRMVQVHSRTSCRDIDELLRIFRGITKVETLISTGNLS